MSIVDLGVYHKEQPLCREEALAKLDKYLRYELRHSETNIHNTMVRARRQVCTFNVTTPGTGDAIRLEEWHRRQGNKETTITHELHTLELMAASQGIKLKIAMPKKNKPLIDFLDTIESRILIEHCMNLREHAIVMTLLYCGLRLGELVRLDLEDVDLTHRLLYVKRTKTRKDRKVVIGKECAVVLAAWLKLRPELDTRSLFVGEHGHRIKRDRVGVLVRNISRRARLQKHVTPHVLRHTCATNMLRSGVPLPEVALQLGDTIETVVAYYLHGDIEELKRSVDLRFKY